MSPYYLINIKNQPNPILFLTKGPPKERIKSVYEKKYSDPFRFPMEYSIFLLLCSFYGLKAPYIIVALTILGLISWIMMAYSGVMVHIFKRFPIIRSDIQFLKVGLTIAGPKIILVLFIFVSIMISITGIIYFFTSRALQYSSPDFLYILTSLVFLFLGLYHINSYGYNNFHERTIYSPIIHFVRSIKFGNRFDFLINKNKDFFEKNNYYDELEFEQTPKVIFLCIESYGSIAYKDPSIYNHIKESVLLIDQELNNQGFFVSSTLSTPPLFSGGSWLSYTTLLFGIRIADTYLYNILFKNNRSFTHYKSILQLLKSKGYHNFLLSPLGGGYEDKIEWDVVEKNFNYDTIFDWNFMNYSGPTYKYLDVGVTIPDQYSLAKANQEIKNLDISPYTLFYITLNSHVPYSSPTEIVENWQEINNPHKKIKSTQNQKKNLKDKYKDAIKYQIDLVKNFISKNGDNSTVFVVFGDHQPPFITEDKFGLDTPIHIISKNESFVSGFCDYGFTRGFQVKNNKRTMKHEGFYSMFMINFNRCFGKNKNISLPYFPDGIILKA